MDILQHVRLTYRQMRVMAGVILIASPVAIVLIFWVSYGKVLPTLSHYYFGETDPGLLRTLFTGFLILVGGLMLAYRGFDGKDNWIHNAAGVFAVAVALFPKGLDKQDVYQAGDRYPLIHGTSAVLLFLAAAYAVLYSGGPRLRRRLVHREVILLKRWRMAAIIGMISGAVAYAPYVFFRDPCFLPSSGVLLVEMTGFFGFAFYWLGMTHVILNANRRLRPAVGVKHGPTEMRATADDASHTREPKQTAIEEDFIP